MNTELQLIIYHVDGKSVWTVLVITLSRGHMCIHSGLTIFFYLVFCYYNKIIHKTSEMAHVIFGLFVSSEEMNITKPVFYDSKMLKHCTEILLQSE
jgi:hypothetical protein